jgi:hypothetical protein
MMTWSGSSVRLAAAVMIIIIFLIMLLADI